MCSPLPTTAATAATDASAAAAAAFWRRRLRPRPLGPWIWAVAALAAVSCRPGRVSSLAYEQTSTDALEDEPGQMVAGGHHALATEPNALDPNLVKTAGPSLTTFGQGLYRGQDPRLNQVGGIYYYVGYNGQTLSIWKQRSLLDRGAAKSIGPQGDSAFSSPIFIDRLGGQSLNAWFLFGSHDFYRNPGADPYDNADQWVRAGGMPWTDLNQIPSVPFDFEIFQNPQEGAYKGRWYLVYVRNDPGFGAAENVHITEITSIGANGITLSNTSANADNMLISHQSAGWTDVIAEAPGVAIHGQSVTLSYAGNGAPTSLYAVGLSALRPGANPLSPASWVNIGGGQCGGTPAGPSFAKTEAVWGPGVARFVRSADGTEDWMMYHSKVFDTFVPGGPPEPQQTQQERWTRQINIAKIGWRTLQCSGQTLTIPDLGSPVAPGTRLAVPSGDPGPQAYATRLRIEAESMIPFGFVMGPAIQQARTNSDTESITAHCSGCSGGTKITNLNLLAQDVPSSPQRAGLTLRNLPPASGLAIGYAALQAGALDIFVDGKSAATVAFAPTGGADVVRQVEVDLALPVGSELSLVYEVGKSQPVDLDYIELLPP